MKVQQTPQSKAETQAVSSALVSLSAENSENVAQMSANNAQNQDDEDNEAPSILVKDADKIRTAGGSVGSFQDPVEFANSSDPVT